jgi:hypothetical protein
MAETTAFPMPPGHASIMGRLYSSVLGAGLTGALLGGVGAVFGGPVGAVTGMTLGVAGHLVIYGVKKGIEDDRKWAEYQAKRHAHFEETGEVLPDLQRTERWKRGAKMLLGTTAVAGLVLASGIGIPAAPAIFTLGVGVAAVGASYLATRLAIKGWHRLVDRKYMKQAHEESKSSVEDIMNKYKTVPINGMHGPPDTFGPGPYGNAYRPGMPGSFGPPPMPAW